MENLRVLGDFFQNRKDPQKISLSEPQLCLWSFLTVTDLIYWVKVQAKDLIHNCDTQLVSLT